MYNDHYEKDAEYSDKASLEKGLGVDATTHAAGMHNYEHQPNPIISNGLAVVDDDHFKFDAADLDRVQRRLKQRHVQMCVSFAYSRVLFID